MDNFLIPLFLCVLFVSGYSLLCIVLILLIHSYLAYIALTLVLFPYVAVWYYIQRNRWLNYLKLILEHRLNWDVDRIVDEYKRLFSKKEES